MTLIKALELSVKQWQLMVDGETKHDAYMQIGKFPPNRLAWAKCFLCDCIVICDNCIQWNDVKLPCDQAGVYFDYLCEKATKQDVLDHLKSELKRLK